MYRYMEGSDLQGLKHPAVAVRTVAASILVQGSWY
jgi:hypothetical protein